MDTHQPVVIMTDSTSDLTDELVERYRLEVIPLYVVLGEDSYKDGVEMDTARLLDWCDANKTTPKTSSVSQADFMAAFRPHVEAGESIVYIGLSSEMSSTLQNARLAAGEFPEGDIHVVDSLNLSSGVGFLAIAAREAAEEGLSAREVAQRIRDMVPRMRVSFVINNLTYLYRGGRCNAVQLLGSNMLHIKPEIVVNEGKMTTRRKYKGSVTKALRQYCQDQLKELETIDPRRIMITNSFRNDADALPFEQLLQDTGYFRDICKTKAGCVISSHCGADCMGLLYLAKEDSEQ